MAQGAVPPSTQQPATAAAQSAAAAQQAAPADNFAGNQVLHILVGHSVVIRTDARLRRVLVGNPAVVTPPQLRQTNWLSPQLPPAAAAWCSGRKTTNRASLRSLGTWMSLCCAKRLLAAFRMRQIQVEAEENRIVLTRNGNSGPHGRADCQNGRAFFQRSGELDPHCAARAAKADIAESQVRPGGPRKNEARMASISSARGLLTHRRHRHPAVRAAATGE